MPKISGVGGDGQDLLDTKRYQDLEAWAALRCPPGVAAAEEPADGRADEPADGPADGPAPDGSGAGPEAPADEAAFVLLLRGRIERGAFRRAAKAARSGRAYFPEDGPAGLWGRLAIVLDTPDDERPRVLAELHAHAGAVAAATTRPGTAALALELQAQAMALEFLLQGGPLDAAAPIVAQWERASAAYRDAGLGREAGRTTRRAARFVSAGYLRDHAGARALLRAEHAAAVAQGDDLRVAEARFALAEGALREWFAALGSGGTPPADDRAGPEPESNGPAGNDLEALTRECDLATEALTAAGVVTATAQATATGARLLLAHGAPEGVAQAEEAAVLLREHGVDSDELALWQDLVMFHTRTGDGLGRARAHEEAAAVSARLGNGFAADGLAMGVADTALRDGRLGEAQELTSARSADALGDPVGLRVVRSSALAVMGLTGEATALLRSCAEELEARPGVSGLLPQVYLSLSGLLAGDDPDAAEECLRRGAEVAGTIGDPLDRARCLGLLAWTIARRSVGAAGPGGADRTAEYEALFGEAVDLLLPLRTLEALDHLATALQQRGQAAFFRQDAPAAEYWLACSEEVGRAAGLGPTLAFTLGYQGILLLSEARTDPARYDDADARFAEAQRLFTAAGMTGDGWRLLFHRAVCALESGDRIPAERQERWAEAGRLLTEAAAEADALRIATSTPGTAPVRAQEAGIASAHDKGELYRSAFELHWHRLGDAATALYWLERAKSRALLDGLAALGQDGVADGSAVDGGAADSGPAVETPAAAEAVTWPALRAALAAEFERSGQRLVVAQYRSSPTGLLLLGLRHDWEQPRVEVIDIDLARLRRFTASTFHRSGEVRTMSDGALRTWVRFAGLVGPLASWAQPGDVVVLVPHGPLHDLPLHTLPVDGVPLLLRNPVVQVPSSSVLADLLRRDARGPASRAGGASVLADPQRNLPHAVAEGAAVSGLLGVPAVTGEPATRAALLEALETAGLVHLAGHGLITTGSGFERGVHLSDGPVRAADLVGRRIRAGTVVLSGCETGVNEQRAGDEPVGLPRALLLGGARSVLVSQWRVADSSSRDLLTAFHRKLATGDAPALALHHAAAETFRTPGGRLEHLYHWGAFVLVGDWA
ncbi:CHAT domain-containing protein [Kitasatospora indigofera]|uniref:CHAT domain-containing protein n=1 Tax=Kitasatospora indigofera TaxID=67307 RepID=UPI0036A0FA2D